ncbi:MAG: hypothetical protein JW818_09845 [Pirellulales bacterium]|nr:hypothetical protein [Pirellulales bacterium]
MTAARIEAIDYVLDRSWTCRRWRRHTCRLAGEAFEFLQRQSAQPEHAQEWRSRVASHLAECVRHDRYGNPVVIWILLNVVVPVVVRLVIEWWVHRKEA